MCGGFMGVYGEVRVGCYRSDKWEGLRFLVQKWSKNWEIRFSKKSMFFCFFGFFGTFSRITRQQEAGVCGGITSAQLEPN